MKPFSAKAFTADRAWGSSLLGDFGDVAVRLHWTDQPYRWHRNTGVKCLPCSKAWSTCIIAKMVWSRSFGFMPGTASRSRMETNMSRTRSGLREFW
ncbi:hypothetical protein [Sphingomonas sp. Ant H11]|uniref:hypothetical protein n=1 Tax=Sphingomonas sp. Ant H11 TaxID=1564113 RepID=UPI000B30895C|nr:hypothetical protein [Sphingomonas sp. Ant H11]